MRSNRALCYMLWRKIRGARSGLRFRGGFVAFYEDIGCGKAAEPCEACLRRSAVRVLTADFYRLGFVNARLDSESAKR